MAAPPPEAAGGRRRRRRPPPPPPRLAWGGEGLGSGSGSGSGGLAPLPGRGAAAPAPAPAPAPGAARGAKRSRRGSAGGSSAPPPSASMLWVDKYAPTDAASDLCVAPKKVAEIRRWMVASAPSSQPAAAAGGEGEARLLVLVGSPGVGKSAAVLVLAAELGWGVQRWNSDAQQQHRGERQGRPSPGQSGQLASFEEFLGTAGMGFGPLDLSAGAAGPTGSVILLEDLPNLHSPEAALAFRSVLARHVRESLVPTVLVFSDVCEGRHRPSDLERLVESSLLYSPLVKIQQINAVARPRMRKCLRSIARAEGARLSDEQCDELHAASRGDVRHAIMALQFRCAAPSPPSLPRSQQQGGGGARDTKLSTFHALGKLLYAKRQQPAAPPPLPRRPPLEFVPEDVMNYSSIEPGGALAFLGYHSPEFFTDAAELSRALDHFSDAAVLLDRQFGAGGGGEGHALFPLQYVSSLAGRAVADANVHPAPNRFRQLSAPKVFEVMQKKRANGVSMIQLCRRLSYGSNVLSLDANVGSLNHFITDSLPYLRSVLPLEVDRALANLHSYARPMEDAAVRCPTTDADVIRRHIKEQEELLAGDEIADDDSDVDNEEGAAADGDRVEVAQGKIPPQPLTGTSLAEGPEVIVIE